MKKTILATTLLLIATSIIAKPVVKSVQQEKPIKDGKGIFYFLPKTMLKVEVTTIKTTFIKGPFFQYAGRFLGTKDFIKEDHEEWNLESLSIQSFSIADTSKIFHIQSPEKVTGIYLNTNNVLCAIGENPKSGNSTTEKQITTCLNKKTANFDWSVLNEETLHANSTTKMAELTAKQLYAIRESKNSYLLGDFEFPSDGVSTRILFEQLCQTEKKLTELFIGKTVVDTLVQTIEIDPSRNIDEVLFRFANKQGIVDKTDLSGSPIYVKIETERANLNLSSKQKEQKGIRYQIAGNATVTIYDTENILLEKCLKVAQLGYILSLDKKLTKNKSLKLILDPATGEIKHLQAK